MNSRLRTKAYKHTDYTCRAEQKAMELREFAKTEIQGKLAKNLVKDHKHGLIYPNLHTENGDSVTETNISWGIFRSMRNTVKLSREQSTSCRRMCVLVCSFW